MARTEKAGGLTARRVLAVVIAVALAIFVLQNRDETTVALFGFDVSLSLWLVLLVVAILGAAVGFLIGRRR